MIIAVVDGKRQAKKAVILKRQTKADYDKQELERQLAHTEGALQKAESNMSDETITAARTEIQRLPEEKRTHFNARLAELEKRQQEQKERAKQEKRAAEAEKNARKSSKSAKKKRLLCEHNNAPPGYSHMRRGQPGYAPHLDGDDDGIACDKHR